MTDYRREAPEIIRSFLLYHETVKGHSRKTVDEYFLDLRTFFRYLKVSKGLVPRKTDLEEISIDDFAKLELRTGKIIEAKKHPKADKLYVFKVDLGTETRQIVSGIAKYFELESLVGQNVVVVANLKPAKLRGEVSEGMILLAEDMDKDVLSFVSAGEGFKLGSIVK